MDRPDDSPAVEVLQEVVPKTSAWTDAEREKVEPVTSAPMQPVWANQFAPGAAFTANGWDCVVRAVGEPEPGYWFAMIEPLRPVAPPRVMSRSEFRRLKTQIGKKATEKVLEERKAKVAGGQPS